MKKATTILAAFMLLISASSFAAGPEEVTARVQSAFKTDFSSAANVDWEKKSDFYFATFTMNNSKVSAAYNEEGELIATSRLLDVKDLPLALSLSLSKKYDGYTIAPEIVEMNVDGQTTYLFSIETDKKILKLKGYSNGDISVENKIKK